jgi:LPXTG-site transpeptidase (sortase) family protein
MKRLLTHRYTLTIGSLLCFVIFILFIFLTYGPVVVVEAKYQYKKILNEVFHVQDFRSLILPTIKIEGIHIQNKEFGMDIPKLYLDEPIVFNIDPHDEPAYTAALKKGIAHAAGTELPAYSGLGYYFAHSSNPNLRSQYNAVFYLLGKLEKGDSVNIWYEGTKYEYIVNEKKITNPDDVSFLQQDYPVPTVVLQTCWPPGTTLQRMLVFAERKQAE